MELVAIFCARFLSLCPGLQISGVSCPFEIAYVDRILYCVFICSTGVICLRIPFCLGDY